MKKTNKKIKGDVAEYFFHVKSEQQIQNVIMHQTFDGIILAIEGETSAETLGRVRVLAKKKFDRDNISVVSFNRIDR
ncbi:MAG: hypothetical protein KGJ58_02960 [Patescibacteria group bacterium]|nr:hypothetical protein [Patescibacteria group bacterium]MDE1988199.1 hypothetical protein [Patescibacteria group bacterium]MDE2218385.1 hypothetical protein [Patescibacteria group bacterium]